MKKIIVIVILLGAGYFIYNMMPQSAEYLHGTWQVIHDPDNSNSKETFKFTPEGKFILDDGFTCIYAHIESNQVSIMCETKNGNIELTFQLSDDKTILTNPSGTTYKKI